MFATSLYKGIEGLKRDHFITGSEVGIAAQKAGIASSDTTSPIVVQGIDNLVVPIFVRQFPLWAVFRKVPANGLSHTWTQQTSFSQNMLPSTIAETGTFADDANSYQRRTTNVSVFAQRRTLPIKASLAGAAGGGPGADLMARELEGGMLTLARDGQNEMLRFQTAIGDAAHGSVAAGATAAQIAAAPQNPDGMFDPNGFNSLRYIANNETPPENTILCDISTPGWTDQRVLRAVHNAVNYLWDKGGSADMIVGSTVTSTALFADQLNLIRYEKQNNAEILPGYSVRTVDTDQGPLPVLAVPGNSIGTYIINDAQGNPHIYSDLFILDTKMFEIPYLGNPEPTVIRIPSAVTGQLFEQSVIYAMYGLAPLAPSISLARVQLKLT